MWYIWLIASGIFFIIEIATVGFLVFWLGIAALLAMCVSFITDNVFIQTLVFVISSCLLIPLTKPLVGKLNKKDSNVKTNAYSLVGKTGLVTVDINVIDATGQVKINGEVWSAKAEENIVKDTEVEVLSIDGVKLFVKPKVNSKII